MSANDSIPNSHEVEYFKRRYATAVGRSLSEADSAEVRREHQFFLERLRFNITGVPSTDGLFNFTVQVSDSYSPPNTAQQTYQVRISDQMNMTGPSSVWLLYNQAYTATGPLLVDTHPTPGP